MTTTPLEAAKTQLGVKYVWGGVSPKSDAARAGFDCSGLTQWACNQAGISIPRTSQAQWEACNKIEAGSVMLGDLVFFKGSDPPSPGHVGIVSAVKGGRPTQMINAPYTGTVVRYDSVTEATAYGIVGYGTFAKVSTTPIEFAANKPAPQTDTHYNGTCLVGLPLLAAGDRGTAVITLELLLHCTSKGVFTPALHALVVYFQKARGLTPDGVVGPATWSALIEGTK